MNRWADQHKFGQDRQSIVFRRIDPKRVLRDIAKDKSEGVVKDRIVRHMRLMSIGLDAYGCLDEALDLILGKAGLFNVAKQIHGLGLIMKVVDNFRVRGR